VGDKAATRKPGDLSPSSPTLAASRPVPPHEGEGKAPAPLALLITDRGARRLYALNAEARALGLFAGQKAADAAALVPELVTHEADPDADTAALEALCDWCVRFSPAVAVDGRDGLFLDISGVSHLWDGEQAMADDLLARLAANGIPARIAVADTAGAAWAFARHLPSSSMEEGPGMVVRPLRRREAAVGLRALPSPSPGRSGHTTTQPSSIEEEGS